MSFKNELGLPFFSCHQTHFNVCHAFSPIFHYIFLLLFWRKTCFASHYSYQPHCAVTFSNIALIEQCHLGRRLLVCTFIRFASNKIKTTETDTQLIGMPRCQAQNLTFHSIDANIRTSTNFDFVSLRFASSACHYFECFHHHRRRRCHHHDSLSLTLSICLSLPPFPFWHRVLSDELF